MKKLGVETVSASSLNPVESVMKAAVKVSVCIRIRSKRYVEFWEGVSPLEFGELSAPHDAVTVVGYPIGGGTIPVIIGIVSRIEILLSVHGSTELLGLQIKETLWFSSFSHLIRGCGIWLWFCCSSLSCNFPLSNE